MSVLVILILASLFVALLFLAGFIWAVRVGQYDDTSTPSLRVLTEESTAPPLPSTVAPPKTISTQSKSIHS